MITSIFETDIFKSIAIENYIKHMTEFIVNNRGIFSINDKIKDNLRVEPMLKTIISDIYKTIVSEDKLPVFSFIDFTNKTSIPEGFLFTYWNLDVSQIKSFMKNQYDILSSLHETNNKILYNISNIIGARENKITDVSKFQQTVIRDFLSRSYHETKDNWLTPNILYYLVKFYSIIISTNISRSYNIPYNEQMFIACVLAIFFLQKCHDKSTSNPLLNRLDFISKSVVIREVLNKIDENYHNKELSVADVCTIIRKNGSSRLSSFTERSLFSLIRSTNPNQLISLVSLEYPPYWFFSVLLALSGMKTNLYHSFKNLNLKNDVISFTRELNSSKVIANSVLI